jgi:NitT/TauT family transport system permease protein
MAQASDAPVARGRRRPLAWSPPRWAARHRWLLPTAFALLLVGIWEAAVVVTQVSPLVLPRPSEVVTVAVVRAPLFWPHLLTTAMEVVLGFLIAAVLGGALGVLIASSRLCEGALFPTLVAAQVMPKIAIAPLLIVWFGFGINSKLALTALISFFPIVINTIIGLNLTRKEEIYLFRSLQASRYQTFLKLRLPNALPVFFGGLKVAATLAVIGAVVGEFTGGKNGLGYLLMFLVGNLDTTAAFAAVLYLTLLGLLVFFLVALVERLMVPAHMLRRFDPQN